MPPILSRVPIALLLTLAANSAATAPASAAAPIRECGDISSDLAYNITSRVVGRKEARRVARIWSSDGGPSIRGLRCRYRDTGYEAGDIRCTGSGGRVVRWQTYS